MDSMPTSASLNNSQIVRNNIDFQFNMIFIEKILIRFEVKHVYEKQHIDSLFHNYFTMVINN